MSFLLTFVASLVLVGVSTSTIGDSGTRRSKAIPKTEINILQIHKLMNPEYLATWLGPPQR